ncbi:MAG: hypothetical protein V3T86_01625 [Planctomycetota bacterium]
MQKLLVGLVLFLTASLGVTAYSVYTLRDRVDELTASHARLKSQLANRDSVITDQEIDRAIALQKQVDRRRRLRGMVRSVMRRLDNMIKRDEMAPLEIDEHNLVEAVILKYMAASDDLMTLYFREPGWGIREMGPSFRRALLKTEREKLQADAAVEVNELLEDDRGTKIAKAMFYRNWKQN